MRVFLAAAAMVAILATPAYAQKKAPPPSPAQLAAERDKKEKEDAYQAAIRNTAPAVSAGNTDPWANTRAPATKSK